MPSTARRHQLQTSLLYHVINRGTARQDLFHEAADYEYFKTLLVTYAETRRLSIYHWVLMTNNYHLCLELEDSARLSRVMAGIQRAYVHYHHRKYESSGFLFQGRFKSQPIQKERYLLACGRYIEQNPVTAKLVSRAEAYPHSSAQFYVEGIADGLTSESPLYATFGGTSEERKLGYREFLQHILEDEQREFSDVSQPRGDARFVSRLVMRRGRLVARRRGRPYDELFHKLLQ